MYKVVHVKTQEEWDFVSEKLKYTWIDGCWEHREENSCINLSKKKTASIEFHKSRNCEILSFEEWCIQNNYRIEKKEEKMKEKMLNILETTYENPILRRTTVPLFMSNPGVGKTNITEQFVEEFIESKGNKLVTMVLPNLMPNEAVGGVYPNQLTKVWEFYDSEKLATLVDGDCLFLDEVFNGTLKQTLDAMLNVLGQRRLGSGKKMADVMIIAASNPQGLINLTPQIKERFIMYDLEFNSEEFKSYLKNKYGMPEDISKHLCTLINKEKFESNGENGKPLWNYITPRSIEKAINQIGCGLSSPYENVLMPFLTQKIIAHKDIVSWDLKQGDEYEYLKLLKVKLQSDNDALKITNVKNNIITKTKTNLKTNDTKNKESKGGVAPNLSN